MKQRGKNTSNWFPIPLRRLTCLGEIPVFLRCPDVDSMHSPRIGYSFCNQWIVSNLANRKLIISAKAGTCQASTYLKWATVV